MLIKTDNVISVFFSGFFFNKIMKTKITKEKRREYFARYKSTHRQQIKDKDKRYYLNNKSKFAEKNERYRNLGLLKKYRVVLKNEVINHYGGKCACCGEKIMEFLTIDHIEGGRGKKKEPNMVSNQLYCWLKRNNYPPGFQVLCFNCNCAKGFFGECPHKRTA